MPITINTYNESSLHNTLKTLYSVTKNGRTEVNLNGYIYDIITDDEGIFEIQTKNLSKLLPKVMTTLEGGGKITVVYPIIAEKKVVLYDDDGNILSKRKSPKKQTIYSIFDELTGIYPVLLNKNFTLEVLQIKMIEERKRTAEPVQSDNKRRRFKHDWIKTNKRLEDIITTSKFKTAGDYTKLLPPGLPETFCAKDLYNAFSSSKEYPAEAAKKSHLILWVLSRMEVIEFTEIKNRSKYYKIKAGK